MEHFHWQPLSAVINCPLNSVSKLSHGQCECVRATPSFQQ